MKLAILVRRRFEVLLGACFLGFAFVAVVWCLMLLLKAIDPVTFHFNLLLDILPWLTPVVIVGVLFGPLYWKVAGLLAPPHGGLQRLAEARYQLVVGAFFYLLAYTLVLWLAMNVLRIWDVSDFHFNPLVDWIPAVVPPWLGWAVAAPLAWKTLAAFDMRQPGRNWSGPDRSVVAAVFVFSAALLTGGGLLLNEGVYAVTQGLSPAVAQNLIALGVVVLAGGGLSFAALLAILWRGWRPSLDLPTRSNSLDRFRAVRGRLLAQGFVLASLALGLTALLMAAFQGMDPVDFHFYLALDMWSVGAPLFLGWMLVGAASQAIPAWLARRDPAHYSVGAGTSPGPTGPASVEESWGYSESSLTRTGSRA
ncbi:MAG: hypothetical protein WBA31_03965 [Candidatus Dormiibacterota bacterium]